MPVTAADIARWVHKYKEENKSAKAIAEEEGGVSHRTVHRYLKDAGVIRSRRTTARDVDFYVKPEHRFDWPMRMFKLWDKQRDGEHLTPDRAEELASFVSKLETHIWLYSEDLGWVNRPRKSEDEGLIVRKI